MLDFFLVVSILAKLEKYSEGLSELNLCYDIGFYKILIPLYPPVPYQEGLLWDTERFIFPYTLRMKCSYWMIE